MVIISVESHLLEIRRSLHSLPGRSIKIVGKMLFPVSLEGTRHSRTHLECLGQHAYKI